MTFHPIKMRSFFDEPEIMKVRLQLMTANFEVYSSDPFLKGRRVLFTLSEFIAMLSKIITKFKGQFS